MISKLLTTIRTNLSRHQSPYKPSGDSTDDLSVITTGQIRNSPGERFWDSYGLMDYQEIRRLVSPVITDKELCQSLWSRSEDIRLWHHMTDDEIHSTVDKCIGQFNLNESIIRESIQEDRAYVAIYRKEHGLDPYNFKLDQSRVLKILMSRRES